MEYRTSLEELPNRSIGNGGRVNRGGEKESYHHTGFKPNTSGCS